jgi:DNA-binding SARP family transcriptional activator
VGVDLRVWLLGGFRVTVDGSPVADGSWRRNKAKAVVKLLALASGHRLHREQLMDVLWPDLAPEAAAGNLRKAVYFARQALAPEHVRLRGEMLGLEAPHLWIDVEAFEAAAEAGDLKAAVELYGGDLLPEDRFEPWTEERRDQLHAWFARRLLERARELEAAGDARAAAGALERLAAIDPLSEEAAIGVMRAHALAGQRHLALRSYRRLETHLAEELGVAPGSEVHRLHEEIAAGRFPPAAEPPVVATPPARKAAVDPGIPSSEERKLVTVVLLDVTAPSTAKDPERTRLELDRYAGLVAEVLESWGGTAERVIGGSVLAVFGVPTAHEDDAGRALHAGLELLGRSPMPIRIGVGTGEVIAPAGTRADPREIAGAVLEVAARLREEAQPGTVMADERTCRVAGATFQFGEPARLAAGGGLELRARRLVGVASGASPGQPRLRGPMIGRDAELGVLLSLFAEVVASRQPRLLNVVGSAGVGKSRLVAEAAAVMAARRPDMLVLRGRCPSAGRGITYWALGEILREACGISLADPLATSQERCSKGLREILGRLGAAADLDATVFALAATCGVSLPGSPLDRLEPQAVAAELASAWPRFATACAAAGPALLVVEDLHWAGPELLETLELTVARATGPPARAGHGAAGAGRGPPRLRWPGGRGLRLDLPAAAGRCAQPRAPGRPDVDGLAADRPRRGGPDQGGGQPAVPGGAGPAPGRAGRGSAARQPAGAAGRPHRRPPGRRQAGPPAGGGGWPGLLGGPGAPCPPRGIGRHRPAPPRAAWIRRPAAGIQPAWPGRAQLPARAHPGRRLPVDPQGAAGPRPCRGRRLA